jgi:putative ABC transport system permease protein
MWRVTLKGVTGHSVRYALTALAVMLGVAFMASTLVLTDTISHTFDQLYNSIYQSTTVVVRAKPGYTPPGTNFTSQRSQIDASLANTVRRVPGVRAVALDVEGYAQMIGRNGKLIGDPSSGPPTLGEAWSDVGALNPLVLQPGGHPPLSSSEVVIDKHSAAVGHLKVGDRVVILSQLPPTTYTVTGIVKWGTADSPLGASIAAFTPATAEKVLAQPGKADAIDIEGSPSVPPAQLMQRVQAALHDPRLEVVSGQTVTKEGQDAVHKDLALFDDILITFALVALFVGAFLIFNTFSIIVAQRARELALLRAVGAGRSQVTRSVLGESLIIGFVASLAGLVAGVGLALLLRAALDAFGIVIPATGLIISIRTVIVALALGTVVTVAAAILPARRASRVPPAAAMRDAEIAVAPPSQRRKVAGASVTGLGAVLLAVGLLGSGSQVVFVGAGAAALFIGLAMLGPLIAQPVVRVLGSPFSRRGVAGQLARENAMRNPTRTSAAAAALMVSVAVVSLMNVLASSSKASFDSAVASAMRADFVISSGGTAGSANGFSPTLEQSIAKLPQVSASTGVRAAAVGMFGQNAGIVAADPSEAGKLINLGVTQGNIAVMTARSIAVSTQAASQHHLRLGSPVVVSFPTTGPKTFYVDAIYSQRDLSGDYLLALGAAAANFPLNLDYQIYAKLAPGVSAASGHRAIEALLARYPNAQLMDQAQYKANYEASVNQLINLINGLLVLALVIALMSIANTLALCVYERTRELGLLRAVGMTRRQLRSSIRSEAVVTSLLGAIEGLVVGVLLGCAVVASLHSQGVTQLALPVPTLVGLVVVAALAGILAAGAPGRRAARLNILQAITTE